MRQLPDFELIIVGEGPERQRLADVIGDYGLADRVRLAGASAAPGIARTVWGSGCLGSCVVARRMGERSAGI